MPFPEINPEPIVAIHKCFDAWNRRASPVDPSEEVTVSEEMLLAGCRVIYPALFARGLHPEPTDGPNARKQLEDTANQVRDILLAALQTRSNQP